MVLILDGSSKHVAYGEGNHKFKKIYILNLELLLQTTAVNISNNIIYSMRAHRIMYYHLIQGSW